VGKKKNRVQSSTIAGRNNVSRPNIIQLFTDGGVVTNGEDGVKLDLDFEDDSSNNNNNQHELNDGSLKKSVSKKEKKSRALTVTEKPKKRKSIVVTTVVAKDFEEKGD